MSNQIREEIRVALREVLAAEDADRKRLKDTLLATAGQTVCLHATPEDIQQILTRGAFFGKTHKRMPGAKSQCHRNSALCWDANREVARIATGFALSSDGIWREHSWVVLERKPGANPANPKAWWTVETTENRVRYFGYILTPKECELFLFNNI